MKIGILTYHRAKNYGAFLQAYGLCSSLNAISGIDAEIIDFHMKKEDQAYKVKRSVIFNIRHFPSTMFLSSLSSAINGGLCQMKLSDQYLQSDSIEDFNKFVYGKYDVIIAGSDEIWNMRSFRGFPTPYWLPGDLGSKKVSYAASSRNNIAELTKQEVLTAKALLQEFDIITVRDEKTLDLLKRDLELDKKVLIMPDPSLISNYPVDGNRGRRNLISKFHLDPDKKIALIMTENQNLASQIKKEVGMDYQLVAVYNRQKNIKSIANLSSFEWLDAIAGVDYVFSSYFHAICFSIKYGTRFLAFGTAVKKDKVMELVVDSENSTRYIDINDLIFEDGYIRNNVKAGMSPVINKQYLSDCQKRWNGFISLLQAL